MVTVPHIMVGLERMSDYRGVSSERFHFNNNNNSKNNNIQYRFFQLQSKVSEFLCSYLLSR